MENRTFETTYPAYSFAPLTTLAVALAQILAGRRAHRAPAPEGAALNSVG